MVESGITAPTPDPTDAARGDSGSSLVGTGTRFFRVEDWVRGVFSPVQNWATEAFLWESGWEAGGVHGISIRASVIATPLSYTGGTATALSTASPLFFEPLRESKPEFSEFTRTLTGHILAIQGSPEEELMSPFSLPALGPLVPSKLSPGQLASPSNSKRAE